MRERNRGTASPTTSLIDVLEYRMETVTTELPASGDWLSRLKPVVAENERLDALGKKETNGLLKDRPAAQTTQSKPRRTGIDTSGNKRHIQWRRESVVSVFGIARCCVRIVGHCHVVRRTERDRPARLGQDQRT